MGTNTTQLFLLVDNYCNMRGFAGPYRELWRERFLCGSEWERSDYTGREILQQLRPDIYPQDKDELFPGGAVTALSLKPDPQKMEEKVYEFKSVHGEGVVYSVHTKQGTLKATFQSWSEAVSYAQQIRGYYVLMNPRHQTSPNQSVLLYENK